MCRRVILAAVAAALVAGCDGEDRRVPAGGLAAFCEATVETAAGTMVVDVETDYLPRVIACENGAADQAALEAQAVAARSYLYYRLGRAGAIGDGTGDQVYSCDRPPGPRHYQAVVDTSGLVLRYPGSAGGTAAGDLGVQVASFYVAGARPTGPGCRGGPTDPTRTEQWVTYNEGRNGRGIVQSLLGIVDPANHANRGCMSQHGSDCLAEAGYDLGAILRFYYGEDIAMIQAHGACVEPIELPGRPGGGDGDGARVDEGCSATGDGGIAALALLSMTGLLLRDPRRRRRGGAGKRAAGKRGARKRGRR